MVKMYLLYTKNKNKDCDKAREYLDCNRIEYKEINITKNNRDKRYWRNQGINTVPILRKEGKDWILPKWDEAIAEYLIVKESLNEM